MSAALPLGLLKEKLLDLEWRLNNLYYIKNKEGQKQLFKMKPEQLELFRRRWHRNVILKARQLGMTTEVMIIMLDAALFNSNTHCGVIAQGLDEANDLFENKIKFAYDNLPDDLKSAIPPKSNTGKLLAFKNGSYIRVGTSMRSGTLQYLHISEFGKTCKKYPDRAQEVINGSIPAVSSDGMIFIESTAEGGSGHFYDICNIAKTMQEQAKKLTRLDWKFFFFPWYRDPKYALTDEETEHTVIPIRLIEYFNKLENDLGIELTENQRAWYTVTERTQGAKMFQEYPSTPEEAFKTVIEGAYFTKEFERIYQEGRITEVPFHRGIPVKTWWDLGMNDEMVIWFTQDVGGRIHVIDVYSNSGETISHYAKVLNEKREKLGYEYSQHTGPHDLAVRELFGSGEAKTRLERAKDFGIKFTQCDRPAEKLDAIEASRVALNVCWFDEQKCERGIKALSEYRKEWNSSHEVWRDHPYHDWTSNFADAFQTLALSHPMFARAKPTAKPVSRRYG